MNQLNTQLAARQSRPYFVLFFLFILAMFFDAAATSLFMIQHGPEFELHPLVRLISFSLGPVYGPIFGALLKVAAGGLLVVLYRPLSRLILPLVTILSVFAGAYNIFAWPLYQRGYFDSLPF